MALLQHFQPGLVFSSDASLSLHTIHGVCWQHPRKWGGAKQLTKSWRNFLVILVLIVLLQACSLMETKISTPLGQLFPRMCKIRPANAEAALTPLGKKIEESKILPTSFYKDIDWEELQLTVTCPLE